MEEFTTWTSLATLTGATALVLVIIQVIKPMIPKINTRLMVLILSILVTQLATFMLQGDWTQHVLAIFNAFIVTLAAMGAYEVTFKTIDTKKP